MRSAFQKVTRFIAPASSSASTAPRGPPTIRPAAMNSAVSAASSRVVRVLLVILPRASPAPMWGWQPRSQSCLPIASPASAPRG